MTDPIADMLTRIRNGAHAKHATVDVPSSNVKKGISDILLREGYIKNVEVIEDNKQNVLRITLKYSDEGEKVISGIKRISKPGLRVSAQVNEVPKVLGGLGTAIISTSKGLLTDKECRKEGIGGEVVCYVW